MVLENEWTLWFQDYVNTVNEKEFEESLKKIGNFDNVKVKG